MGICYFKLFDRLNRSGKKKSDLLQVISPATLAKLSSNKYVTTATIEKLCMHLHCQPQDIMEFIPEEK